MPGTSSTWTFFTNHAHVLFVLVEDPTLRLREVADRVGITERAAQRIVHELQDDGYLEITREGRRNRYAVRTDARLRHPVEGHRTVGEIAALVQAGPDVRVTETPSAAAETAEAQTAGPAPRGPAAGGVA